MQSINGAISSKNANQIYSDSYIVPKPRGTIDAVQNNKIVESSNIPIFLNSTVKLSEVKATLKKRLIAKALYPLTDSTEWIFKRNEIKSKHGGERVKFHSPDGSVLDGMFIPSKSNEGLFSERAFVFVPGMNSYYEHVFFDYFITLLRKKLGDVNFLALNHPGVMVSEGELSCDGMALSVFSGCSYLIEKKHLDPSIIVIYGQSLGGVAATRGGKLLQNEYPDSELNLIHERSFVSFPEVVEKFCGSGFIGGQLRSYLEDEESTWSTTDSPEDFEILKGNKLIIYSKFDCVVPFDFSFYKKLHEQKPNLSNVKVLSLPGEMLREQEHYRIFSSDEEDVVIEEIKRMLGLPYKEIIGAFQAYPLNISQ